MKTTGIVRGIDSLGRIVLPKELRTNMHIDKDSKLEIFVEGDQIILKKHRPAGSCDFCGELAADTTLTETFLRMGIDELSVSPTFVLKVRDAVRNIDLSK